MITCAFENQGKASLRHVTVNVLVLHGNDILLARRARHLLEGGKWGLPGGFMDRDETLVQAATREVMEETGWSIQDLTLFRVIDNPNRPNEDRQNVAFTYTAHAVKEVGNADSESEEVKWFSLDHLPPDAEIAFDFAETIALYRAALQNSVKPL